MIYDAEHFFDAFRDDAAYALRCLRAAAEAGAENVTLCDTNGSSLPGAGGRGHARGAWPSWATASQVGIHTHDDAGCGVANSLVAVEPGAALVQGTMNGYGERCGNANLVTILPDLQLKLGSECVAPERLERLTEIAHLVDELCNVTPEPRPALRGPERLRAQGRDARGRRQPRRPHLRARRPGRGGGRPPRADLRAVRQGHGPGAREPTCDDDDRGARGRAGEGARAPRATTSRPPTARSTC